MSNLFAKGIRKEIDNLPSGKDTTHPLTRLLRGYEVNGRNLSVALGCAEETARKKLKDPMRITLGDLRVIHNKFGVPIEDLRGAAL